MLRNTVSLFIAFFISTAAASASTFVCTYPKYSSSDGLKNTSDEFVLIFVYDQAKDKYFVKGNVGVEEVASMVTNQGINFIEVTNAGNMMLTTISSGLDSVHSRHTMIPGFQDITATQYYGSCRKN